MSDDPINVSDENQSNQPQQKQYWGMNLNTYCMLMNLIQLLPGWGWVIAILMWIMNKDNSPEIDRYGKNVANWIISYVIYFLAAGVLSGTMAILGVIITVTCNVPAFLFGHLSFGFMFFALAVLGVVFPIMAAVKANNGVFWKYPLSIPFFK